MLIRTGRAASPFAAAIARHRIVSLHYDCGGRGVTRPTNQHISPPHLYYPCDGFHGMVLGNVASDTLKDVWQGGKLNELRDLTNKDFPKCIRCPDRAWCKVCPMRNFNETGDMFVTASARCALASVHRKVWEESEC